MCAIRDRSPYANATLRVNYRGQAADTSAVTGSDIY
jgi:hypothetical protein